MWLLKQSCKIDFDIHHVYFTAKQAMSLAVCVTERVVNLPRLIYLFNKLVFTSLVLLQSFLSSVCFKCMYCVDFFWLLKCLVQVRTYLNDSVDYNSFIGKYHTHSPT